MVYTSGKKYFGLVCTTFLILIIIGAATLSMTEFLGADETTGSGCIVSNVDYTLKKHTMDWLSCEAASITKIRESSSYPLRNGSNGAMRLFAPSEINNASVYLAESSFQAVENNYVPSIKDTIFLNLRL